MFFLGHMEGRLLLNVMQKKNPNCAKWIKSLSSYVEKLQNYYFQLLFHINAIVFNYNVMFDLVAKFSAQILLHSYTACIILICRSTYMYRVQPFKLSCTKSRRMFIHVSNHLYIISTCFWWLGKKLVLLSGTCIHQFIDPLDSR